MIRVRQVTGANAVAASRRRISLLLNLMSSSWLAAVPPYFGFLSAGDSEVGGSKHGQGDMAVPGQIVPGLAVIEAGFVFGGLEGFFDGPPGSGHVNQFGHGGRVPRKFARWVYDCHHFELKRSSL